MTAPAFDRAAVETHVALLHALASGCSGSLMLLVTQERGPARTQRFAVGDTGTMVEAIMAFDGTPGVNLYSPFATMRPDMAPGKKGGERDVLFSLAAVADVDTDKGAQPVIPLEPNYVISSSPGNFQKVYAYPAPLTASASKGVLAALNAATGGDSGEKDASHVWRVGGTINVPTAAKLLRGRDPTPAAVKIVKPFDGSRTNPSAILALKPLKPPSAAKAQRAPKGKPATDLPKLADALTFVSGVDSRDVWVKVGAACHTANAREAWDVWSRGSSKFDEEAQGVAWASFNADRPAGVTLATVYALAKANGWSARTQEGEFVRTAEGAIVKSHPQNIATAITSLGVSLRLNTFTGLTEVAGLPAGFGPLLDDAGAVQIRLTIHERFSFLPPRDLFEDVLVKLAHDGAYHPVKTYLSGLVWDGKLRLDKAFARYLGGEQSAYSAEIGRCFFVSLVARIFSRGCQSDHMVILEGAQGTMKSQACRTIASDDWFSDSLPAISDHKDLSEHIRGKWLIEIAELSAMNKTETNTLKAFLTRRVEKYRPSYGKRQVVEPRECSFVGTVNDDQYLKDASGARRFWPYATGFIDLKALKADRNQLFAEAVDQYRKGARWWPSQQFEASDIRDQQEQRYVEDGWGDPIAKYLDNLMKKRVTVGEIARDVVAVDLAHLSPAHTQRIRAILARLGWVLRRSNGIRSYFPKEASK